MSAPCKNLEVYLDGTLGGAERASFTAHAATCASCGRAVRTWPLVEQRLLQWDREGQSGASAASIDRLVRRARERKRPAPARLPWMAWLAVPALALAAAFVAIVWVRHPIPVPQPLALVLLDPRGAVTDRTHLGQVGHRVLAQLGSDRIGVGSGGRVRIERADTRATRLVLESGTMAAEVSPRQAGETFTVAARQCEVHIKGTRFGVELTGASGEVRVTLDVGSVVISDADQEHALTAGNRLSSLCDGRAQVVPMSTAERQMVRDLLALEAAPTVTQAEAAPTVDAERLERTGRTHPRRLAAAQEGPDLELWRTWIVEGNLAPAEAALTRYLATAPHDDEARSLLADCQRKAGKWTAAVATHRAIIRGGDALQANRARYLAAVILQEQLGRHREAVALLRAYLGKPETVPSLVTAAKVRLARSLLALGEQTEALALLKQVIQEQPGTADAREAKSLLEGATK